MEEISVDDALFSFGLSGKEIKIYLACLELGSASANEIAEKAYINRSTTYDILKTLLEKGITSKIIREKTTYFEAAIPEKLISMLDEKKEKIKTVLPQLKLIQEHTLKKPVVQLFQGKEGFKTILDDILITKKNTDVISTSKIFEIMTYYFPYYIKRRAELKIKARVIQEYSAHTTHLKKSDEKDERTTKSIKNFDINSTIFIYGDKVATIKLVENEIISVLTTDKTLANDQRKIFEILWAQAK
jgi:HTH-type transcriptional regulator, sugar sensing transcriptional regulator